MAKRHILAFRCRPWGRTSLDLARADICWLTVTGPEGHAGAVLLTRAEARKLAAGLDRFSGAGDPLSPARALALKFPRRKRGPKRAQ